MQSSIRGQDTTVSGTRGTGLASMLHSSHVSPTPCLLAHGTQLQVTLDAYAAVSELAYIQQLKGEPVRDIASPHVKACKQDLQGFEVCAKRVRPAEKGSRLGTCMRLFWIVAINLAQFPAGIVQALVLLYSVKMGNQTAAQRSKSFLGLPNGSWFEYVERRTFVESFVVQYGKAFQYRFVCLMFTFVCISIFAFDASTLLVAWLAFGFNLHEVIRFEVKILPACLEEEAIIVQAAGDVEAGVPR